MERIPFSKPPVDSAESGRLLEIFKRCHPGLLTAASVQFPKSSGVQRTLQTRAQRAEILYRLRRNPSQRRALLESARLHDQFNNQLLTQQEISVTPEGLGELGSLAVDITLGCASDNPPVCVVVPALSGDTYGVEPLLRHLALRGYRVICAGHPESYTGKVTPEFANAVKSHKTFDSHVEYFHQLIQKLYPQGDFMLAGYSAGGAIAAGLLNKTDISARVSDAILFNPCSTIDQASTPLTRAGKISIAALRQLSSLIPHLHRFPYLSIVTGLRQGLEG